MYNAVITILVLSNLDNVFLGDEYCTAGVSAFLLGLQAGFCFPLGYLRPDVSTEVSRRSVAIAGIGKRLVLCVIIRTVNSSC